MLTKAPPEILSPEDLAYKSTLNERDRRRFLATKAADLKAQGFSYRKVNLYMSLRRYTRSPARNWKYRSLFKELVLFTAQVA